MQHHMETSNKQSANKVFSKGGEERERDRADEGEEGKNERVPFRQTA